MLTNVTRELKETGRMRESGEFSERLHPRVGNNSYDLISELLQFRLVHDDRTLKKVA